MTWHYPPSRPRRAEGGLRARARRGAIGQTWWSRRFIEVLESYGMGGRLTRGRSYARAGQVLDLSVRAGAVTARVQGSRARPYRVRIEIAAFGSAEWRRVEEELVSQALFRAKLLAGEMPEEIEEAFDACGLSLFPRSRRGLAMYCSCPDGAVPCKHLAATFYLVAEAFDADPFLVLAWRGRDKDELLARLRALSGAGSTSEPSDPNAPALAVEEPSLAECVDRFWLPGTDLADLRRRPAGSGAPDLLLRELEPPDVSVRGRNLADVLRPAYQAMAAAAERDEG